MEIGEHVDVLDRDGRALADTAAAAGLTAEVPSCPGWQVRDVLVHLTGVHRWARSFVADGRRQPSDDDERFFVPAADPVDGYRVAHRELVDALRAADPDLDCWSFLRAPSPLAFWARRQAHEAAIHRADIALAAGELPDWPPAFAADGIDELMSGFFGRKRGRLVADPPTSIAVVPDDVPGAWHMRIGPAGRTLDTDPTGAALTLRGPANALYLLLWNRADERAVRVDGDRRALTVWRELARITWS